MVFSRSKTHNKRRIHWNQFKAVVISTITLTTLGIMEIIKPIDYELVVVDFEPIPQYKSCLLQDLPEEFVIQIEQGTITRPYKRFTDEEAEMLMKLGKAEAEIDGVDGMCMAIQVVLNRRDSDKFPDTIEEVIFQDVQFSSVSDGRYYDAEPDDNCLKALELIDSGEYDWVEALYFENAESSWQQDNCEYLYTVGHHRFYK